MYLTYANARAYTIWKETKQKIYEKMRTIIIWNKNYYVKIKIKCVVFLYEEWSARREGIAMGCRQMQIVNAWVAVWNTRLSSE